MNQDISKSSPKEEYQNNVLEEKFGHFPSKRQCTDSPPYHIKTKVPRIKHILKPAWKSIDSDDEVSPEQWLKPRSDAKIRIGSKFQAKIPTLQKKEKCKHPSLHESPPPQ